MKKEWTFLIAKLIASLVIALSMFIPFAKVTVTYNITEELQEVLPSEEESSVMNVSMIDFSPKASNSDINVAGDNFIGCLIILLAGAGIFLTLIGAKSFSVIASFVCSILGFYKAYDIMSIRDITGNAIVDISAKLSYLPGYYMMIIGSILLLIISVAHAMFDGRRY